jgi:hypothetical protein
MSHPPGHHQGGPEMVCNLKKALYGSKQASRAWHLTLKGHLEQHDFLENRADPSLYILHREAGRTVYLLVYVDDLLIAAQLPRDVATVKTKLLGASMPGTSGLQRSSCASLSSATGRSGSVMGP